MTITHKLGSALAGLAMLAGCEIKGDFAEKEPSGAVGMYLPTECEKVVDIDYKDSILTLLCKEESGNLSLYTRLVIGEDSVWKKRFTFTKQ